MSGVSSSQAYVDTSPRYHKIMRVIFFIATCSWSRNTLDEYADSGLSAIKLLMRVLPLMIVALYALFGPYRHYLGQLKRPIYWALWLYTGIGVLCGLVGIMPMLSLWKGIEIIVTLLWIGISCRDEDSTRRELRTWLWYIEVLVYWTLLLALINPSQGITISPTGLPWIRGYFPMINPNGLGGLANFALVSLLFLPAKYKPIRLFIVGMVFLFAQSRTQYTAFAAILFVCILDGFKTKKTGRVLILSGLLFVTVMALFGILDRVIAIFLRGQSSEDMGKLSGRVDYWVAALRHAGLFGGGLATGSRSLIYLEQHVFAYAVSLHSTYFEAILGVGYIASVPFICYLVGSFLRQFYRFFVRKNSIEGFLTALTIILAARSIMSIGLALFCTDFCIMIIFSVYLSQTKHPRVVYLPPPKPKVRRFLDTNGGSDVNSSSAKVPLPNTVDPVHGDSAV